MTPLCPYCDIPMRYIGADDGLGDFGTAVCDVYECWQCEHQETGHCIETEPDFEDDTD